MEKAHRLVAGYATRGQGAGPVIVTARAGLFSKYGLEVEVRLMGSARAVVRGLMEGVIQFGNLAAPALLRAGLLERADLVFLTGGINQQFLLGRPGIKSRRELSGKTIGFVGDSGLNDILVYFLLDELEKEGIHGIRLIPTRSAGTEGVEKLVNGDCDALVMTPPEAIEARRLGCSFLVDFSDYGLNYALGGIAGRRQYIRENEEITREFVRAYIEGMHRYRTDRAFTVKVQQEYSELADVTIAEETYDITRPGMPEIPYPVPAALSTALQVISREVPGAASADPGQFIDDRFIRELEESGF